ncbi:MAG: hypothetical protein M0009_16410 [Deltaproteobacteria bacterium]|nr:hypothetical protein [Deltaproteobacteria bacterium]
MESQGEDRGGRAQQQTTGHAKWTFMVYMAGDSNLDGAALRDIAEMAKAGAHHHTETLRNAKSWTASARALSQIYHSPKKRRVTSPISDL